MSQYKHMTKAQLIEELEAMRESLERLEAVVDGCRDAVFISDEDSRFILVNAAACELTGYSEEALLGTRIPDLHEEVDLRAYNAHHDSIMDGQEALTEADVLKKDGTKVAAEFNNRRIVIAGTPYMHTVARDITERKRAEEELRESEGRFRVLVEEMNDGFAVRDGGGILTYVNKRFCRMLGRPRDEVEGHHVTEFLDETNKEILLANWAHRTPRGSTPFDLTWIEREGGKITTIISPAALPGADSGDATSYASVISDITERKRTERSLRDSRNRLRNLAVRLDKVREEERTALARELHDEVGQALTAMAMDLAMFEKEIPAGQEHLADRLHSMLDLTQDSVDRVNRMSYELRSPVLDILGLEAAVESEVSEYQERWGTEIGLELEVGELEALPERDLTVYRILQQCLSNVRRHAEASRVEISLRVAGEKLVLEVLDDGIGITDEQMQDHRSFGLVGMRERVERLGGTLRIKRRPEGGTRIRASVPITPDNG